jgi:hypothetical protein
LIGLMVYSFARIGAALGMAPPRRMPHSLSRGWMSVAAYDPRLENVGARGDGESIAAHRFQRH